MSVAKTFELERVGDTLVFTPMNNLGELEISEALGTELFEALQDVSVKNLVLDFHRTDYFGSTALTIFIKLWNEIKQRHGHMALCNLSEHQREILSVTRLAQLWHICASRDEAVNEVSK